MHKLYYKYDSKKGRYRRYTPSRHERWWIYTRRFLLGTGSGIGAFLLLSILVQSPRERELIDKNNALEAQYDVLDKRLDLAYDILDKLQQRDDNLYRVILQADPIAPAIRQAGYNGTNRYEALADMPKKKLLIHTTKKLDILEKQLYIESKSMDDIVADLKQQDEKIKCVPAIQPVSNRDLKYTASGYGWRTDPIYGTRKFHKGMDFSAKIGTDIYATGNGKITFVGWKSGYGRCVIVDHGFDYETLYAHMSKTKVHRGQKVVRGQIIGLVGSSGKSTGPHLHYEVHYKNHIMNPVNYYFMDLNAEDYDKMIDIAANHGKVMD
ncbi:MAG TPA: peptidoglycan DD-metalloendopeptidase family protein [Bacteroidaceae bacterium]|nr:peptidoglycan DD-metalloendopeptidase family protein [Bacteroidaceae bacterium]